ncbi:AHH domain-containing protein [Vibrio quintilis]|uniref:AHH domain-containing protein n=1 Tax=Vibrio quintilis TaxID=1117707 RepID=UPI001F405F45|nr:hypothetical protein [Vibrio quintilis]
MSRHYGNHHGYTDAIRDQLDKIDLNQSKDLIMNDINKVQSTAKSGMSSGLPIRSKDMYNSKIFGKDVNKIGRQRVHSLWTKFFG